MKVVLTAATTAVFSLIFLTGALFADEKESLRNEISELKQMMIKMQQRLDDLEQRNKELEEQSRAKQKTSQSSSEPNAIAEQSPTDGGFIQRAIQTLNPDISVIGIFSASYF